MNKHFETTTGCGKPHESLLQPHEVEMKIVANVIKTTAPIPRFPPGSHRGGMAIVGHSDGPGETIINRNGVIIIDDAVHKKIDIDRLKQLVSKQSFFLRKPYGGK